MVIPRLQGTEANVAEVLLKFVSFHFCLFKTVRLELRKCAKWMRLWQENWTERHLDTSRGTIVVEKSDIF